MKCVPCIMLSLVFLAYGMTAMAYEKKPYRHIAVLGADFHVSNGDNKTSPLILYHYFMENFSNPNLYAQYTLKTTSFFFILGYKTDDYFAGIRPELKWITWGAYRAYTEGENFDERTYKSQTAGAELFYERYAGRFVTLRLGYQPDYHFYIENKGTTIDLPTNHSEHNLRAELSLGKITSSDLNRVRHGFIVKGMYQYTGRQGYGTFEDMPLVTRDDSSIDTTHKIYLDLGACYAFSNQINIQLDGMAGIHDGVDRNNAEQIGYINSRHAAVGGYYSTEFYHNRYVVGKLQIGFPVPLWDMRLQPGFNVLYMPKNNEVVGVEHYPKTVYKSVSLGWSFKMADVLPFFINYAYGMDADRKGEKGNHEIQAFIIMALGKN